MDKMKIVWEKGNTIFLTRVRRVRIKSHCVYANESLFITGFYHVKQLQTLSGTTIWSCSSCCC